MVESVLNTIVATVAAGEKVSLPGFGTFESKHREARTGRNPRTKEAVEIPASTVPLLQGRQGVQGHGQRLISAHDIDRTISFRDGPISFHQTKCSGQKRRLALKRSQILRICMSALGVLVCGVSVGMFRAARLGVDPFQSLMSGLNAVIPIRFGTLYVIVNVILLLFSLIFDRKKIGLATLINLTLLGYVAEFSQHLTELALGDPGLVGRLILLAAAIVIMCFGSALYFNADLGVSTYDAVSLVVSERQDRIPFKWCRVISDVICVAAAFVLLRMGGQSLRELVGSIGPATIITAFFMGPLISLFSGLLPNPTGRKY